MDRLKNKVAVVTGGTRGLGLAIAEAFAREGASVVVASRAQPGVDEAVTRLGKMGARAAGMSVDVSDLKQVEALADLAVQTFGRIDIWVNNAGAAGPYGGTLDFSPKEFLQVTQTNILGVYYGSRTAMAKFLAQRSGKLINVLGHGYNQPVPWQNAYGSSKAWIRSFTSALAEETNGQGVGVYAFNPGMVLTDLLTSVDVYQGSEDRLKNFPTVVQMWAKPPEIPAQKVVWIASQATDGKTGLLINLFSPWQMLRGAVRVGIQKLFKKESTGAEIHLKVIPPFEG